MPTFGPIRRKDLIHYLHQLGFDGPYSGGKHQFMLKGTLSATHRLKPQRFSVGEWYCAYAGWDEAWPTIQ